MKPWKVSPPVKTRSSKPPLPVANTAVKKQLLVVLDAVKERELPEADDDFAQLASEFDTTDELKEDLKNQAAEEAKTKQGVEAREKALEELLKLVEVLFQKICSPSRLNNTSPPRGIPKVTTTTLKSTAKKLQKTSGTFINEVVLDAIADQEEIQVEQSELIEYILSSASSTVWIQTNLPRCWIKPARSQ